MIKNYRLHVVPVVVLLAVFAFALTFVGLIRTKAATSVNLGTADNFAVLADTAISDAAPTGAITGDVGLGPTSGGSSITGLTSAQVSGIIYAMDASGPDGATGNNPTLVSAAKTALTTAYLAAEGQTPATTVLASITDSFSGTGYTLTPGIYKSPSTMGITGTLTLDAGGDPDAVFIFQAVSSLTTAASTDIVLINGAQACNVFWQVGSSATLGTGTLFKGNLLALTSITDNGGSVVQGRLLARNGAVSLNNTTIVKATCAASPTAAISVSGGAGNPPLINVKKVPTPLALPFGGGAITYDYAVLNIGPVDMNNVKVTDDKCAPIVYLSGDTDGDGLLDERQAETWRYRCTTTLLQTTMNTVTATGQANGYTAVDTANATVVVGPQQIVPPLIHLVKVPSAFFLPVGGGAVTYTYTVTNPGTAPLSNVSVIDNKCTGLPGRVVGHPGDLNSNNLLESNETWTFTCLSNLTQTTINTGIAEGSANGLTVIDFAPATVVVDLPKLPNTGISPAENTTYRNIALLAGIFLVVSASVVMALKKQTA